MRYADFAAFTPGTLLTVGSTVSGTPLVGGSILRCSVQAVLSGSMVGSLQLQASNDQTASTLGSPGAAAATVWSNVAGAAVAVSGSGTYFIPFTECCYRAMRMVYIPTSGSGTVTSCNLFRMGL